MHPNTKNKKIIRTIATLVLWVFIAVSTRAAGFRAPGTRRMAGRLDRIARDVNVARAQFESRRRAELIRRMLPHVVGLANRVNYQQQLAYDLLNSGQCEEAIKEYDTFERLVTADATDYWAQVKSKIRIREAMCYLRMGELENCLSNHTSMSCIFPISGSGVHKFQRGSRGAIRVLTGFLSEQPDNLAARWLLNVACMTVGEYPEKVPSQWLLRPEIFSSDYEIPRFQDVAGPAGLDIDALAGGAIMEDFDGDDLLDIMVSSMSMRGQLRLFHNNGDGTFTERTNEAGLIGEIGGLNLTLADYNNDGHPDVLVLRGGWMGLDGHHPNSLLRNNGDGTFSDVTEEAGLLSFHPTQTAVWIDYNGDGWLDLFVGNESSEGDVNPCELFRNNADGTFTECAKEAGLAYIGYVKAVASGDYNNDGRPDLYLSAQDRPNVLFRNDGPATPNGDSRDKWKFTDVSNAAGVTKPVHSFPTWFFDYDNDGWLDIFVAGYQIKDVGDVAADYLGLPHTAERPRLYRNNHDGTFTDTTKEAHLDRLLHAMGNNFGDLDNDGWLDFYVGTGDPSLSTLIPNRMFRNAGGRFFQDVTTSGGFGHLQKGHGIAFGDIDNDGDQDVFEEMGGAYPGDNYHSALYENPGNTNHWIKLKLEGVRSNRSAIGARIKVTVKTPDGERTIYRTVSTGGSFGCSPLRQEIGLGDATSVATIEISWPASHSQQVFRNLTIDRYLRIREGDAEPVTVRLKTFKLPSAEARHDHSKHLL